MEASVRVEEVFESIYRIGVPLAGNPLKEVNSYFIRGEASDLLVDTGFRSPPCKAALEEGLRALGSDPARRDVYITHLHGDHSGLADCFVGEGRSIYLSAPDLDFNLRWSGRQYADKDRRFLEEGFTAEMLADLAERSPSSIYVMKDWSLPCVRPVREGDVIPVGGYRFRVVLVPGHTPGNTMLWEEDRRVMFTGDHILFDITPNITFWEGMADSLGGYLESLERSRGYPVETALPGHRRTGDYHARIDALLTHHRRRIAEVRALVIRAPGLRALEIAGSMRWRIRAGSWEEFPLVQKRFAVGECLSHLDYLMVRGEVRREKNPSGQWVYVPGAG